MSGDGLVGQILLATCFAEQGLRREDRPLVVLFGLQKRCVALVG